MASTSYGNQSVASREGPLLGLRSLFYAVSPAESAFERLEDVPRYVDKAVPFFIIAMLLETVFKAGRVKGDRRLRLTDAISICGVFSELAPAFTRITIEATAYIYLYDNYHLLELPWDSPWVWLAAMILYDFTFYWTHRFSHEINILWAVHQVHHSSEYFNLTTALRQPVIKFVSPWCLYLPMALFIPPTAFVVHRDFNLIYQFWIHTDVIGKLGPLEWIFNIPSHHRVHHGRNRYCIDKNHAGFLIIWDRMFGTFEEEKDDVTISYGLVSPLNSWDTLYTQFGYWKMTLYSILTTEGWKGKLWRVVKGPGWSPGKPRLGNITDIPEVYDSQSVYKKRASWWFILYNLLHLIMAFTLSAVLSSYKEVWTTGNKLLVVGFILWGIINMGCIFEQKWYGLWMETARCLCFSMLQSLVCHNASCPSPLTAGFSHFIYYLSAAYCLAGLVISQPSSPNKMKSI